MRANLANREPDRLKQWQEMDLYEQIRSQGKNRPQFILHDGPPYANGNIHLGHAVNKILKDIIVKSKTLSGFDAPFIPGWDCHGLPIELNVEKKVGKPGQKVDAKTFRDKCREYAQKQVDGQREDFKRLGILADWDNPYLTMSYDMEANIVRSLGKIIDKGHLHKGSKPVHWCLDCGSALAEAEVEYGDKISPAIDVVFRAIDSKAILKACHVETDNNDDVALVIWTTTPWTLPANMAVSLHPNFDYVLVHADTPAGQLNLLLADALYEAALQRYGIEDYTLIGRCQGQVLEHQLLQHPFYSRHVPVILGDHVTTEAGTGAVHTAPGHGQDDFIVGQKYGLEIYNPVGSNGVFLPDTELFAGKHVNKVNDEIIALLQTNNALLKHQPISHSYPHCWRHGSPIIFRATPQWFISMNQNGLKDQAMKVIEKTSWMPGWGKARIESMVENRPDWCISRQRTWGVPITLFVHKETGELHPETDTIIESVAQQIEQHGIDAWFSATAEDLIGDDAASYDKVTDTLDVWFDSGVTHVGVLDKREELARPADLYLEGSDQHRGWFQSSLLTSVAITGDAPYKTALTHGFTVDQKGHKMSKSSGNGVEPIKVCNALGADILRLWVAATDYSAEMSYSKEILNRVADSYRRIRNTARFLLANLNGFEFETQAVPTTDLLTLDRWIISRADAVQKEIIQAYESYNFHTIYRMLHNFCSEDLGSLYLDIIKDRQYTLSKKSLAYRSAQTAMYYIAQALCRWMAPILSFTADEIWEHLPSASQREPSVFLSTWHNFPQELSTHQKERGIDFWKTIFELREIISKDMEALRSSNKIGSSLDAEINIYCDTKLFATLNKLEDELRFALITSYAQAHPLESAPENCSRGEINTAPFLFSITASSHPKCIRCWHHREDVGQNPEHPECCQRCVDNISGNDESRCFT